MDEADPRPDRARRMHERSPIRLIVEYEGAEDFIGDYTENLSSGGTFIHTARVFERDARIELVLSFPGLLQPVALAGVVKWSRGGDRPGIGLEFLPGAGRDNLDALIEQLRRGDLRGVARVVKVLVVEDNPHVAELICEGVTASARRNFGDGLAFTFTTAEDGAAALELLQANTFDIVIIDVYLPVLDGPQVITHARSGLGLVDLPIIAVSAGGDLARAPALAAGANLFLDKPMRLRQLIESMRQLVRLSA